ncbi:putative ATPase/DNA-binding SARP family transcriptional activator [Kibdelosporangium banguiense]|uniref:ATPase/DNA-binding SARP family transcriptional activator n=1 Tax=Kibdelosporangium banguiense TaxID=1365924 RepID=A0ABS4TIQ8_9PSEU|nr:BTAD domain-containing putative transcriptional regulator [Kibdelosporangium banguiense]MBP2324310.1 putative ATPase/DNA-binding SARP family transcriptional activator [Kibdelosporangium banguiense]
MWFGVLGPVAARHADGSEVALGGPKVRTLLALLLADAGHVISTDRLIDGLYGDEPPESAANALQSQVSRLRRSLGGLIELHPTGYRLAIDPSDVDAFRFEELARDGRQALDAGNASRAEKLLGAALELWRGPAEVDSARLDELRMAAVEDHIEAQLALNGPDLGKLQELVAAYPLRERLRGQLMRALAASGRQAEALTAFEDARRTLADELGADPSAELAETHLAILKGQTIAVNPVPAQLTSFVGREPELARVRALLEANRLVTLTGPGGTGKTRLAVEAAGRLSDVCFVELSGVVDELSQVVLAALGLREPARSRRQVAPPIDRLVAALTDRPMVLVFDNCEHVIEAAAQLTGRLLAAHAGLRILATSREPLGITGETLFAVPQLTIEPAIRLFTDRAKAVRADFEADEGDIAHICQALDGLPLAIELAAARVRSLPVAQVAARLEDRFALLSKGSRAAEARHRTLRAVVEWSWDLLDDDERAVASRLTVFAGGARLADAESVCGLPDTMDLLASLADKSLLEVSGDRYRMLETIQAFCAEHLGVQTSQTRRAHAQHFLGFARESNKHLLGAEQLSWLAAIDAEHDNLQAALRWAVEADVDLALQLVGALSTYWWMRGRRSDGAQLCFDLAVKIGPDDLTEDRVLCVLNALAANSLPDHLQSVKTWAANRTGPPMYPFTTVLLAPVVGPPAPRVAEVLIGDDPWSQALAPLGRGYQQLFDGDIAIAERTWTTALAEFRAIGERWGIMQVLSELGTITSWRGDHARAIAMLDEAISLVGALGATEDLCDMLSRRADCRLNAGDLAGAGADHHQVLTLANRHATPLFQSAAHSGMANAARLRGDLRAARELAELALAECGTGWFGPDWARSQILVGLGWIACAEGNSAEAVSRLAEAMKDAIGWGNVPLAGAVTEALSGVALLNGEPEQAARLLGAGAALRGIAVVCADGVTRVTEAATAMIGADAFASAYAEGQAMSRPEALRLASASL